MGDCTTLWARPMSSLYRTCLMLQLESYCISRSLTTSPLTFEIDYCTLAAHSTENWIQNVCPDVQLSASGCTNIPHWTIHHWCLNQSVVVISISLCVVTLCHFPEQWDRAKDVLLFLIRAWNSLLFTVLFETLCMNRDQTFCFIVFYF